VLFTELSSTMNAEYASDDCANQRGVGRRPHRAAANDQAVDVRDLDVVIVGENVAIPSTPRMSTLQLKRDLQAKR
jgi:hypothetical protein